ncbi:MAG: glycerol kinase GlpK [Pseudomonadota bacterium]
MTDPLILALDQGTTSSRALVFDQYGQVRTLAQKSFTQHYPRDGWVEHAPEDLWTSQIETARTAITQLGADAEKLIGLAITNQRETTLIWDRRSGKPIAPAIVWQDRRTATACKALETAGHGPVIAEKTGLLLDPYFSASKIAWLLDNVPGAREAAITVDLAFGTVDTYLLWHLTGGRVHATDETNASRTSLYNIHTGTWDDDLLALFNVPRSLLPEVKTSAAHFGVSDPDLLGKPLPILAMAGDQQAAAFGQACYQAGQAKMTYGTGGFLLMHTGETPRASAHRLLTTRACRTGSDPAFALEGSIFIAGAVVQWLRDGLGLIETSEQSEVLASAEPGANGVYLVPAFTGLGAPHWDAEARGAIFGLTRDANRADIARASLEAVGYQTADLLEALRQDGASATTLRVDGGMAANDWLMTFVANMTGTDLIRPANLETTALGVAALGFLQAGTWSDLATASSRLDQDSTNFNPTMALERRRTHLNGWRSAVAATRHYAALQNSP